MEPETTYYLEMTDAAQLCPASEASPMFHIQRASVKRWQFNRFLYKLIGAKWKWTDKLAWADEQWKRYVESDRLHTFVAHHDGALAGYFELNENSGDVEIAYFGLTPEFIGQGLGGVLLTRALEEAWELEPVRVWVHTCTLDHEAALSNYKARGMRVYKTETETPQTDDEKRKGLIQ